MEQHWYIKTNTPPAPFAQFAGKTRKQAEKQMRREWLALSLVQRVAIRRRNFETDAGDPYMEAVGHNGQCIYDGFTLAELIEEGS